MPPKHSRQSSDESDSEGIGARSAKRCKTDGRESSAPHLRVHVLDTKLRPETVLELSNLVECDSPLKLKHCSDPLESDVIVTALHMRARLERHIPWNLAKQKGVVTVDWLRDSVRAGIALPYSDYVAVQQLAAESSAPPFPPINPKYNLNPPSPETVSIPRKGTGYHSRFSCQRNSPLVCPNQKLVEQLAVLMRHRELEGLTPNALSYERAIAVLKAYPQPITEETMQKAVDLPGIGGKMATKIEEFMEEGVIAESASIARDERYQCLSLFTTIYGIGPTTARELYSRGLRTLKDLKLHYDVPETDLPEHLRINMVTKTWRDAAPTVSIKMGILLKDELDQKIPRTEVELMRDVVMEELNTIVPGCVSTITGGYRRGKQESNDVDIVISHAGMSLGNGQIKEFCERSINHLHAKGLVTHVMHLSSFRPPSGLKRTHWDALDQALTVFVLPESRGGRGIHRRLDLIFAAPEVYWTAVVGWTGSKMFERDLRSWAKQRGFKFASSGISRLNDSKAVYPTSERNVFEVLGLEYIDPIMRNADV